MSYIAVLQGVPTWLPFVAADVNTGAPRVGITFSQVDVAYKKATDPSFILKLLSGPDFRENGNGVYEILFSSGELAVVGSFIFVVNGNGSLPSPPIRQALTQAVVQSSSTYTPGTISLNTNILTGNLVDLKGVAMVGEAVSARLLQAPGILGTNPNRGGVGTQIVAAKTDQAGFFALEVIQGSVIDVVIPSINYRRTLTVPSNATDKLFDIP